jgi:hypothetical protein
MNENNNENTSKPIPAGRYKGRGVVGSEQYSDEEGKTPTLAVDLHLASINKTVTTFLYFSDKAMPYSKERLEALGVTSMEEVADPTVETGSRLKCHGIDKNEVDVEVTYEFYEGKERMRVQILTGGGRVVLKPATKQANRGFMARLNDQLGAKPPAQQQQQTAAGGNFKL